MKKNISIVFLSRRFWPDVGGVEKHVYEISKRLIKKGYKVIVITESLGKENELEGIQIERIDKAPNNWFKKFYIWKWMFNHVDLLQKADVVHAHDVFYWYLPFKLLFLSKKSFVTFHGYESYPIARKSIIFRKMSEYLSDGNITVGDFIKKWYYTKPNFVIYGGVDIPKQNVKPKRLDSAIFIGRLDEHTGILDYARAVDLIRKDNPRFDFAVVGDGVYKKRLKRFKPLGFKNDSIKYLKQYNFAFVSRYLSILEALANRRLVFALYDNPVKEDYLRMAPFSKFIIVEKSAANLVEKIKYFQKNPKEAERLIGDGFEWVKNQTWENLIKTYLRLWKTSGSHIE